ncbi:hypothetical protein BBM24_18000 [Vibrio parahaemolyticus]|uniref:hypothetical protein n=1 Tax=Vibrio TaxID=662 RepID=UPI00084B6EB7|nr:MULTISPECIES: hypothetical protein [Vibrio harveyi group]EGR3351632.1 hypothetical protein [Vibrio parahaemolyticus]EJG1850387.1 hypothetical protein [Vibrio parahaemolyticus]EJX1282661.1 hypothetical protein [Vibrio parahaemolyticus]MCR9886204.1 hypothetical protein [Vibrio alginolyticus]MDG2677734.1 hypothetical protein [Vibrio parahaemolyticus]
MMKLKIQTIATSKFNVSVAWFSGLSKNGVIDVRVSQIEHRIAVAELTVVRYLLWDRQVFGHRPGSGKGLAIGLSCATLRSLKQSSSNDLRKAGQYLKTWLDGVQLNPDEIVGVAASTDQILMIQPYRFPQPVFDSPVLGPVAISRHAIQRYQERFRHGYTKSPWLSLQRQLCNPELRQARLSDRTRFQKLLKYGDDGSQIWHHPTGDLYFLLVPQETHWLVITVFSQLSHSMAEEVA